jgi:hypothetical protein
VGTKVLVHDGHVWAHRCWSARGMSGHESAGPLKGMFFSIFCRYTNSVRTIETIVQSAFSLIMFLFIVVVKFTVSLCQGIFFP